MASLNRATIIGRLGRDPDIRQTRGGKKMASFSVATSERWKDKSSGQMKEATEWHRVVVFNEHLADITERFLKKGSQVLIEGKLMTRTYEDNSGKERSVTEIVLQSFGGQIVLLGEKASGSPSSAARNSSPSSSRSRKAAEEGEPDDIPF